MDTLQNTQAATAGAVLRRRCWTMHERLEAHPLSRLLLSDELTPKSYAQTLVVWQVAWSRLETLLALHTPAGVTPDRVPAKRAYLADLDLDYLRQPTIQIEESALPVLPHLEGAGWYGLAYVMQGSTMGGQVIAAHLSRLLGLEAGLGASFFSPNRLLHPPKGRSARQGWADWLAWLDGQIGHDPALVEQAGDAAVATFTFLHDVFSAQAWATTGLEKP